MDICEKRKYEIILIYINFGRCFCDAFIFKNVYISKNVINSFDISVVLTYNYSHKLSITIHKLRCNFL